MICQNHKIVIEAHYYRFIDEDPDPAFEKELESGASFFNLRRIRIQEPKNVIRQIICFDQSDAKELFTLTLASRIRYFRQSRNRIPAILNRIHQPISGRGPAYGYISHDVFTPISELATRRRWFVAFISPKDSI